MPWEVERKQEARGSLSYTFCQPASGICRQLLTAASIGRLLQVGAAMHEHKVRMGDDGSKWLRLPALTEYRLGLAKGQGTCNVWVRIRYFHTKNHLVITRLSISQAGKHLHFRLLMHWIMYRIHIILAHHTHTHTYTFTLTHQHRLSMIPS